MANHGSMSKLLSDLRDDLMRGRIEEEFEFANRKWRMHTLSDAEVTWSYQYVTMSSNLALLSSRKAATLASAISHIDDNPVEALFDLPNDAKLVGFLENSPEEKKSYFREKLYAFLSDLPDRVVTDLYLFYEGLDQKREQVMQGLKAKQPESPAQETAVTPVPVVTGAVSSFG